MFAHRAAWIVLFVALSSSESHPAFGDDVPASVPPPSPRPLLTRGRTIGYVGLFGRANPAGTALVSSLAYRRVFGFNEDEGYETSYVQAGIGVVVCPAYVEPGVHLEILPAAFGALRFEGNAFRFFGTMNGLLRFPGDNVPFGDAVLASLGGEEHATWGERAAVTGTLRAKVGWLLARTETTAAFYHFDDPGPYLYESEYDTLMARDDGIVVNRSQVFVVASKDGPDKVLLLGPAFETAHTFGTGLNRTRAGGALFWVPADAWGVLRRPQVFVNAGVNVTDPNRSGSIFALGGIAAEFE